MLRWICGKTRIDKIRNEDICSLVGITTIEDERKPFTIVWSHRM